MHYITAVHVDGGDTERHITSVRWLNGESGVSQVSSVEAMVKWLSEGNHAYVGGEHGRAALRFVTPNSGPAYLRSMVNDRWTDNLLRLPRY